MIRRVDIILNMISKVHFYIFYCELSIIAYRFILFIYVAVFKYVCE
jgi:hypothetical protein